MGLFRRKKEQKATSEDVLREIFGGNQAKSGIQVTWRNALECVTALACTRVIAEGISQVPWKVFRTRSQGGRDAAAEHPLYDLLHRRPNEWQTSFEFREQIALHLVLAGNAFVFVSRQRGVVSELLPFEPGQIAVTRKDNELSYTFTKADGSKQPIPLANMWHLRGPSWSGWQGLDGTKLAREAIGLALATEDHSSRLFANGTRLSGVLSTDQVLKDEQVKALRESWQATYAGLGNTGKTAILWGGLKWSANAMQADHAQMIETRRFQVEQICSALRVMPIMIGYADKTATYASVEQMLIAHAVHTLGPWYERIEQSADVNLLTMQERADGYYVKFVVAGLLRGALKDQAEYFAKALGSGGAPAWLTQDEVREMIELNPMGGSAATLPLPTNVGGAATRSPDDET